MIKYCLREAEAALQCSKYKLWQYYRVKLWLNEIADGVNAIKDGGSFQGWIRAEWKNTEIKKYSETLEKSVNTEELL